MELVDPDRTAPHEFSGEAIIASLSKYSTKLFIFDEAKAFFDILAKTYNESLKTLFTTLYRKPNYSRTTIKHGTLNIQNAYLPMGMATTPEWLRQSLQGAEESAMSGFLARFLMVPYTGNGNHPMYRPPPHDSEKFASLVNQLKEFRFIAQAFTYDPDADKALDLWYTEMTERENKAVPVLGVFYEHMKNEAIHKLSIIMAIDRGETSITRSAFGEAVSYLSYVEEMLPSLLEDLTSDRLEQERCKIKNYVREHGICRREELSNAVHIHGEKLTIHLRGMEADDLIKKWQEPTKTRKVWMLEWIGGNNEKLDG